jgi:non-specific serine/threonine protein kinase
MLGNLGQALLGQGAYERATAALTEALVLSREIGNTWYIIWSLDGLAGAAMAQGEWERSTRLFGAVEALVEASGIVLHPAARETNRRNVTAARVLLGEEAFARSRDAGRAMPLEQAIAEALTDVSTERNRDATPIPEPAARAGLTRREHQVLRLVVNGLSDREIAAALYISPRTVGGHVTNLLNKLGVGSRTAVAAFAVRHGLDEPGTP